MEETVIPLALYAIIGLLVGLALLEADSHEPPPHVNGSDVDCFAVLVCLFAWPLVLGFLVYAWVDEQRGA